MPDIFDQVAGTGFEAQATSKPDIFDAVSAGAQSPAGDVFDQLPDLTPADFASSRVADHATQFTIRGRKGVLWGAADRQTQLTFPQMFQTFVAPGEQRRLNIMRADALSKNDPAAISAADQAIYSATRSAVDAIDPLAFPESEAAIRQQARQAVADESYARTGAESAIEGFSHNIGQLGYNALSGTPEQVANTAATQQIMNEERAAARPLTSSIARTTGNIVSPESLATMALTGGVGAGVTRATGSQLAGQAAAGAAGGVGLGVANAATEDRLASGEEIAQNAIGGAIGAPVAGMVSRAVPFAENAARAALQGNRGTYIANKAGDLLTGAVANAATNVATGAGMAAATGNEYGLQQAANDAMSGAALEVPGRIAGRAIQQHEHVATFRNAEDAASFMKTAPGLVMESMADGSFVVTRGQPAAQSQQAQPEPIQQMAQQPEPAQAPRSDFTPSEFGGYPEQQPEIPEEMRNAPAQSVQQVHDQTTGRFFPETRAGTDSVQPEQTAGIRSADQGRPVAGVQNDAGARTPVAKSVGSVVPDGRPQAGQQPGDVGGEVRQPITFTAFRGVRDGRNTSDAGIGGGRFLSPDRKVAESYAGKDGAVSEETVTFNKPFVADNWVDAKKKLGIPAATSMDGLIKAVSERGYDGLVFNRHNGKPEYVDLRPTATESAGASRSMSAERAGVVAGEEANRQTVPAESAYATPIASRDDTGSQQSEQPLREISPEKKEWVLKGMTRSGGMDRAKAESMYESVLHPAVRSLAKMEGISPADMIERIDFRKPRAGEKQRLSDKNGTDVLGSTVLVRIGDVGRAVIKYMKGSDPATAIHEPLHAIRLLMGEVAKRSATAKEFLSRAEADLGVKNGVWEKIHEEAFVDRFMNYLKTGEAPTPRTKTFFDHVKEILTSLTRSVGLTDASPEFRKFADEFLRYGESDSAEAPAPERAPRGVVEKTLFDSADTPHADPDSFGNPDGTREFFNKAREWARHNLIGKRFRNEESGRDWYVGQRGVSHTMRTTRDTDTIVSLSTLPDLIKNAKLVETIPDDKGRPNVKGIGVYESPIIVGDKAYVARMYVMEVTSGNQKLGVLDGYDVYYHHHLKEKGPDIPAEGMGVNPRPVPADTEASIQSIAPKSDEIKKNPPLMDTAPSGDQNLKAAEKASQAKPLETVKQTIRKNVSGEPQEKTITESQALEATMKAQAKGAKEGYKAGREQAIQESRAKLDLFKLRTQEKNARADDIRTQVTDLIKDMPQHLQGKMLTHVRDADTPAKLSDAIDRVGELVSEYQHQVAVKRARDALQGIDPDGLRPEYAEEFQRVAGSFDLHNPSKSTVRSAEGLRQHIESIKDDALRKEFVSKLPPDAMKLLARAEKTPLDKLSDQELEDLVNTAKSIAHQNKLKDKLYVAGKVRSWEKDVHAVAGDPGGGIDNAPATPGELDAHGKPIADIESKNAAPRSGDRGLLGRAFDSTESTDGTITRMAGEGGVMHQRLYTDAVDAKEQMNHTVVEIDSGMHSVREKHGMTDKKMIDWIAKGRVFEKADGHKIILTGPEAAMAYGYSQNSDSLVKMVKNGIISERFKGKEAKIEHLTLADVEKISSQLTPFEKEYVDTGIKLLNEGRLIEYMKKAMVEQFGYHNLKEANYLPLMLDLTGKQENVSSLLDRMNTMKGLSEEGFVKDRQQHSQPVMLTNFHNTFYTHATKAANYAHMRTTVDNMIRLLGTPEVKRKVQDYWGNHVLDHLRNYALDVYGQGMANPNESMLRRINGNIGRSILAFRISTILKNGIGGPLDLSTQIPLDMRKAFIREMARADINYSDKEFMSGLGKDSYTARMRWKNDSMMLAAFSDPEMAGKLANSQFQQKLRHLQELGMTPMEKAERAGAIAMYRVLRDHYKKQGMTADAAGKRSAQETMLAVRRTQNPMDALDVSQWGRYVKGNAFAQTAFMFTSQAAKTRDAITRDYTLYKQGKLDGKTFTANMVTRLGSTVVLSASVAALMAALREGGREKDERKNHGIAGVAESAIGEMAGLVHPAFQDAARNLMSAALEGRVSQSNRSPLADIGQDLIGGLASISSYIRSDDNKKKPENLYTAVRGMLDALAKASGVPFDSVMTPVEGAVKGAAGRPPEFHLKNELYQVEKKYGLNKQGVKLKDVIRQMTPADRAKLMKLRAYDDKIQKIRKAAGEGKVKKESADAYIRRQVEAAQRAGAF